MKIEPFDLYADMLHADQTGTRSRDEPCAPVRLQISVRHDRKHAAVVRKRLESLVGVLHEPERPPARPL